MKWIVLLCFLTFSFSISTAQNAKAWVAELYTGAAAGWWQYNHGTDDPAIFANQGLDYSHFSPFVPVGLAVGRHFNKWSVLVGGTYTIYFDNELRRHSLAPSILANYPVADGWTKLLHVYGQAEYTMLQRQQFSIGPFVRAGWIRLIADAPRDWRFGAQYFWQLGLHAQYKLKRGSFFVRPGFQQNTIIINEPDRVDAYNSIFSIGAEFGYRYNFN